MRVWIINRSIDIYMMISTSVSNRSQFLKNNTLCIACKATYWILINILGVLVYTSDMCSMQ